MTYRVRIIQDEDPQSPDDWGDDAAFVVADHHSFAPSAPVKLADVPDLDREVWAVFPLFAYIHSGIVLATSNDRYPFNDRFDSGQIGYVVIDRRDIPDPPAAAAAVVAEWNMYLSGDVWGYVVEEIETCNLGHEHATEVDALWGMYGHEYAEEEGAAALATFQRKGA